MAVLKTYQSKGYVGKDGKAPLYVSFYLNREKVVIPCELSVKVDHFDSDKGKVTTADKQHKDHNLVIDNIKARVNNVMVRYRLKNRKLTKDAFWKEFNRPDDYSTFFDYFLDYVKKHPYEIEATTLDVHKDVMNKLQRYCPDLHFDDITEEFILEYKTYLRKKLKNKESTAVKNLSVIKKYVRAAIKAGYMIENPFNSIKLPRNIKGKFTFLTEEELNKMVELYKSDSLEEKYQSTLQLFLFLCFTSLHIGDAKKLKIEDVGAKTFTYWRVKNRNSKPEPIVVPISKPARVLFKKYIGRRRNGYVLPDLAAEQTMNDYLKKIAPMAEVMKKLSHKAGRHTFATIFLEKTKDIATLKEIMGHSDIRETLIYAHVQAESKVKRIMAFNDFQM